MERCGECGYDYSEDPSRLAVRCERFAGAVTRTLLTTNPEKLLERPAPQTWSPLEYAAHVGEAVSWYMERVRRVLAEDVPQLEPFDWDAAAADGAYRSRAVESVAEDVESACHALAQVARALIADDLNRMATGSDGSPRDVRTLLARAGHELAHHELDLRRGVMST